MKPASVPSTRCFLNLLLQSLCQIILASLLAISPLVPLSLLDIINLEPERLLGLWLSGDGWLKCNASVTEG